MRQLVNHLASKKCMPGTQFAFLKDQSTADALSLLADSLYAAKDGGKVTAVCTLNMSKAFDKVRHPLLLQDMFDIGVSESALRWISSYLADQAQQIAIGPSVSPATPFSCGVPQGSVLAPVLFSIYTRAARSVCGPTPSIRFADGIALHDSNSTAADVSTSLSADVSRLSSWLDRRFSPQPPPLRISA